MKIALTGAGGTGKTTLAKYISEKWGIPYLGSVGRQVMAEMGIEGEPAQEAMSKQDLLALQHRIFERLRDTRKGAKSYVTDRCIIDSYVYGLHHCGTVIPPDVLKEWEETAIADLYAHDLVLYAPTGLFAVEADGGRIAAQGHQTLLDAALYGILCKHGFDRNSSHIYILQMSNLDRRKHFCDSLISEKIVLSPTEL